jgi:hypothetical protein
VVTCDLNLYDPKLTVESPVFDSLLEQARSSSPELLLAAAYQWTALEERLSLEFPGARSVAMSGRLFFDPAYGPAPASRFRVDDRVEVAEDVPETRKNELLAGAVLGGRGHTAGSEAVACRGSSRRGGCRTGTPGFAGWRVLDRLRRGQSVHINQELAARALVQGAECMVEGTWSEVPADRARVRTEIGSGCS